MRPRGFTLIELLLVVGIIGIAAGAIAMSVGGDESRKLREETARLAALFRMAQSEARVGGRAVVWEADLAGYRFRPLGAESSAELAEELQRERRWPFEVVRVGTREVLFSREPIREPEVIEIATAQRDLRLSLDALGKLSECKEGECAVSR